MEKGYVTLVIIAMINATISLYYYILVVKAAYLMEPDEELPRASCFHTNESTHRGAGDRNGGIWCISASFA